MVLKKEMNEIFGMRKYLPEKYLPLFPSDNIFLALRYGTLHDTNALAERPLTNENEHAETLQKIMDSTIHFRSIDHEVGKDETRFL